MIFYDNGFLEVFFDVEIEKRIDFGIVTLYM